MSTKIYSFSFLGLQTQLVEVEADVSNGMPVFNIVGLGDASVHESRERVRSSIKNAKFIFPPTRKTINLAPAQVRKHGAMFDLPIAISLLAASKQLPINDLDQAIVIGELSLNGQVKSIPGALLITHAAKEQGFKKIFLPAANAIEASYIDGIEVYPLEYFSQLAKHLQGSEILKPQAKKQIRRPHRRLEDFPIIGMEQAKRALAIAAAGGHNVLLSGSPGCGKTVICRAFKHLQPPMSEAEIIETTKIYSIAGNLTPAEPLITTRPFREVHHTATGTAIIGGGNKSRPGEISLAHNGTLFLDEIAEFPRKTLETLRQPLEDKFIQVTRSNYSTKFPCNFILLATMNPCPCGYHGDPKVRCICTDTQVKNYQKKLSGPLIDRFDIFLEIAKTPIQEIFQSKQEAPPLQEKITKAQTVQRRRGYKNADLPTRQMLEFCQLDKGSQSLLKASAKRHNLSNRAYFKTLKLARTIADLESSPNIEQKHLLEALQYRQR